MDRKLIDYLPDILKNVTEFNQMMSAEQPEIELFWNKGSNYLNNSFILSQDSDSAARWEKILKISSKDTDEIDVRNLRILGVMQGRLPYTYRTFYRSLLAMVGSEKDFKLNVDMENYKVSIVVALSSKELKEEIERLADEIVPANMELEVLLWYVTHRMLEKKTHGELEQYTHEQMTELDLR